MGGDRPRDWQTAAQVAAAIAGVLLVVPTYLIALELFGESTAWLACILIFSVPANSHVLADALSESTFLLFFAFGLWAALAVPASRSDRLAGAGVGLQRAGVPDPSRRAGLAGGALARTLRALVSSVAQTAGRPQTGGNRAPDVGTDPGSRTLCDSSKGGISTKPSILRILGLAPSAGAMSVERERPLDPGQNEITTAVLGFKAMLRAVAGATTIPLLLLSPLGLAAGWTTAARKRTGSFWASSWAPVRWP